MAAKKILVVDDEAGFARLLKLNLEGTGKFEVQTETEGSQAVNAARSFEPDLILLDLNLPKKSGREVLQDIKSDPGLQFIPVVILTSSKQEEDIILEYLQGLMGLLQTKINRSL